jgi:hypothetical protein
MVLSREDKSRLGNRQCSPQLRPPMTKAYAEMLAYRLSETAIIDIRTARKRVQQYGIRPLRTITTKS